MHVSYNMLDAHLNERISRLGRKEEKKKRGSAVVVNWRNPGDRFRITGKANESSLDPGNLGFFPRPPRFLSIRFSGCTADVNATIRPGYTCVTLFPSPAPPSTRLPWHGMDALFRAISLRAYQLCTAYITLFSSAWNSLQLERVTYSAYFFDAPMKSYWKGMHHQGVIFEKGKESWYKNDEKVERDY